MKKYLILLLGALLLTAVSCSLDNDYSVENYRDYFTYENGQLLNDSGITFTVTQSQVPSDSWKQEGQRMWITCDILNRDMEIVLKAVSPVTIVPAAEKTEKEFEDPVLIQDASISGGYLNIIFSAYKLAGSEYTQRYIVEKQIVNKSTHLFLWVDGNNENPVYEDKDKLKLADYIISIPLDKDTDLWELDLTTYIFSQDEDGKIISARKTAGFVSQ